MDEKIIKAVELDIDGNVIRLTPEQARKLHGALGELLGLTKDADVLDELRKFAEEQKKNVPAIPYPVPVPYPAPYRPCPPLAPPPYIVWCGGLNTTFGGLKAYYQNSTGAARLTV